MWPRVVEIMIGVWLMLSPFIFRHPESEMPMWINDFTCGAIVMALAFLSFWRKTRNARLLILVVAAWLVGFGYLYQPHPAPPALQNNVLAGWLLMMFAIIPNEANSPPAGWRDFHKNQ